jgi:hypothetical protein
LCFIKNMERCYKENLQNPNINILIQEA